MARDDVILDGVRFHWLWIHKPREQTRNDGSKYYKYGSTLIFEPDGPAHKALQAGLEEAAKEKWPDKWQAMLKKLSASGNTCLRDGNTKFTKDGEPMDGFVDMLFINASAPAADPETGEGRENKPFIFTNFGTAVTPANRGDFPRTRKNAAGEDVEEGAPYNGAYGVAKVRLWCQDNEHGIKINAEMKVLMFRRDGDVLGGGREETEEDALNALAGFVVEALPGDKDVPENLFAPQK